MAQNEAFWTKADQQALQPLLAAIAPPNANTQPGLMDRLAEQAYLTKDARLGIAGEVMARRARARPAMITPSPWGEGGSRQAFWLELRVELWVSLCGNSSARIRLSGEL